MKIFVGLFFAILTVSLSAATVSAQCVSLTTLNTAVTENFDTLASTGTSSTLPVGWYFSETGSGANATYSAGTGSANSGDTYSFGASSVAERALGGLQSGSVIPTVGACFTNNTGGTISNLAFSYTGEQWRLGTLNRADRLDFQYSLNASSLTTGTWVDADSLDFSSPTTTGSTGALDGNLAANRTAVTSSVTSLSIANGATVWIRFSDFNASGADDGLAVDDFSLTPSFIAPVPNLSVNDVSLAEGTGNSTDFNFTVSLSSPAGPGGVTFDIASADGTATVAGFDYFEESATGVTIAEGESTSTFTVTVSGDIDVEPNETFFVNVTNVTGANPTDAQGQGTIVNDDVVLPVVNLQFASYTEDEAQTLFVFAQRSGDLSGVSTVEFTTAPSNLTGTPFATGGASCTDPDVDYITTNVTLTFNANDEFASTEIDICSDLLFEPTETFPLVLYAPTNAAIGPNGTAFAEIIDTASQFASFEPIGIGNNSNTFSGSIDVTTPQSTVFNLRVTLFDVEFSNSENLDVLLVGPEGQKMLLMADAGGTNGLSGRTTLTFSDNAGQVLPDDSLIGAGSYEPTTWEPGQTDFLAPAPIGPYAEPGSEVGGAVTLGSVFSGTNPNGTWTLYVRNDQNAFQPLGLAGDIGGWGIQLLAPTAAGVSVSGTVKSGKVGIKDARITVSGGNLDQPIVTRTNSFGNYTVEGLTAGETYIITVDSRRYTFTEPTRVLNVTDNVTELDFNSDVR